MRDLARMSLVPAAWIATSAIALAQIPGDAQRAFEEGHFIAAAQSAEAAGDADALAFAARARIADAVTQGYTFCLHCLVEAEATARKAIHRDPLMAEGYVQFAIAMGFRARLITLEDAQAEDLPEKGRDAIKKALELDPLNNWARAALGGWHLEVVHRAGRILGSIVYGASEEEGLNNFRHALSVEPDNLLLHFQFALSTLAIGVESHRAEAAKALAQGLNDPHTDALTRQMRGLATELQEGLRTHKDEAIERLVHKLQGYPSDASPALAKPR